METITVHAQQIRNYVNKGHLYDRYFKNDLDRWNRLCVSMDILGDSCLALTSYESLGIGQDDGEKYLKLYGLLQAVILQQDSIRELYRIFVGENLIFSSNPALENMRKLRNLTAGHPIETIPSKGDTAIRRTFISRITISDEGFQLLCWNTEKEEDEIVDVDLKGLYSSYKCEAISLLETVIKAQIEQYGALPTE